MDQWTIDCLQKYVGEEVFPDVVPKPMLLIELDGSRESLESETEMIEDWLSQESVKYSKAGTEVDAEKLWDVRRQGSSSMKKLASTKLNEGVVVPLNRQIELVRFVDSLRRNFL